MTCQHGHRGPTCPLHPARPAGQALGRRAFGKGLLASAGAAALAACATSPVTGRSSFGSIEDDVSLGRREHPNILKAFGGEYTEGNVDAYVQQLGLKLAAETEYPNLPYHFTVLNTPIVNAFALPGGYVYLTRGLLALAANEAEVAGVLGHEIGHVTARHSAERQTQSVFAQLGLVLIGVATGSGALVDLASVGASAYLQSYSRDQEFEADTLGVRYMVAGGWDPDGMVTFLASLREYSQLEARMDGRDPNSVDEYNMMASHPRTLERVERAMAAAGAPDGQAGVLNRDLYLTEINGMVYGDDPAQGIIDGQWFRHPALRFEFRVPDGFRLFNSDAEVTAKSPQGAGIVFDMGRTQSSDMAQYLVGEWASDTAVSDVERITVNGLPGATGWTRIQGSSGGYADLRLVALKGEGNEVFRFLFVSPSSMSAQFNSGFRETTYSFRRLSAAEAAQVKGFRLYVVPAKSGDSVASLSRTMPFGQWNEAAFRVLNDLAIEGGLAPGEPVKVVRA